MVDEGATDGLPKEVSSSLEKHALLNAVRHDGKAEVGAVVSKIMGEFSDARSKAGLVAKAAQETVKRINSLSLSAQQKLLEETYPGAAEARTKDGRVGLPELPDAEKGAVVLRLPPEPSGFMHIGHAMAGMINYTYRVKYSGQLWLRFEDTNPKKVEKRYYESFREGYRWLGIDWDKEKNVSSDLDLIYEYGKKLIGSGDAYVCACPIDKVKKLRFDGEVCEHRGQSVEKNRTLWDEMLSRKFKEGEWVVRLKGDVSSLDYSLRDPNIFRIIDQEHPVTGGKYSVWPTYDFEVVVEDQICGVTHILRSSEFHSALQDRVRNLLSFRSVHTVQFSRFNFKGTPVQKRLLRPLVEKGLVRGWDDPRMPTIEGVRRRGITSDAIKQFTLQVGYTKSEHEFDWSLLFAVNRKLLDPLTKRLFYVPSPVELKIAGARPKKVAIPFHPDKELGSREIEVGDSVYVPVADVSALKLGQTFRLMDLYNLKLTSKADEFAEAEYIGDELIREIPKVQWVTRDNIKIEVLEPGQLYNDDGTLNKSSMKRSRGVVEPAFRGRSAGEMVQFPRYGFCRVDSSETCILAHK